MRLAAVMCCLAVAASLICAAMHDDDLGVACVSQTFPRMDHPGHTRVRLPLFSNSGGPFDLLADYEIRLTVSLEWKMEIKRSGSTPSGKGPQDWFTGTVRLDPLFSPPEPSQVSAALVTFEPGARTAWHTHPLGQTLIVTSGLGWAQSEAGPVEEIRPGDVVWFAPGEKHWHGASASTAMSHIAIQEKLNGSPVTWMEKVTDEDYKR